MRVYSSLNHEKFHANFSVYKTYGLDAISAVRRL